MIPTISPTMRQRRLSSDSFNSNPDTDINEYDGIVHGNGSGGGGGLRVPTPRPSVHSRPPRDSLVRQSLAPPPSTPRESFIPYSEFGRHAGRPLTMDTINVPDQVSHGTSYVDVDESMRIDPNYGGPSSAPLDDEEFVRRAPLPKPSRFRRFTNVLMTPFRIVKSAFRIPKVLRRRSSRRPVTEASSGWDFRDRTPAPTSIRNQYSNEGGQRAPETVTILFPEPTTAPTVEADHGPAPRAERVASGGTGSALGRSTGHRPHKSRPQSPRSSNSPKDTIKPTRGAVRSSGTTRTSRSSRSTRSRSSFPFSPVRTRLTAVKEYAPRQSSVTYSSSMSRCSSLLHQFVRLFRGVRVLYHLPWVASPPRRIAVDYIPYKGERSKYRARREHPPFNDKMAAVAAENMEPSEGKSWYTPSRQQLEKQMKRGKRKGRHHHSQSYSLEEAHNHDRSPRATHRRHTGYHHNHHRATQPSYFYGHTAPPFPIPNPPYGTSQPFYVVPGPPPPAGNGPGNGLRVPPPARPPSIVSSRPGAQPLQKGPSASEQPQTLSPDPNANNPRGRGEIQRPLPAAQPMYMLVQAPPPPSGPFSGSPGYGNGNSYPYSPPWTSSPSYRV